MGNCYPNSSFKVVKDTEISLPPLELGSPIIDRREEKQADVVINITPPFSSFHYQVNKVCVSTHHLSKPITENFYSRHIYIAVEASILHKSGTQALQNVHILVHLGTLSFPPFHRRTCLMCEFTGGSICRCQAS